MKLLNKQSSQVTKKRFKRQLTDSKSKATIPLIWVLNPHAQLKIVQRTGIYPVELPLQSTTNRLKKRKVYKVNNKKTKMYQEVRGSWFLHILTYVATNPVNTCDPDKH